MTPILHMIALALGILLVVYLPSMVMLRALNIRGSMLLGLAPVWTAGVSTAASLVFAKLGIMWSLTHYVLLTVLLVVIFAAGGNMVFGRQSLWSAQADDVLPTYPKTFWVAPVALIVIGSLLYWLPTMWNIPVEYPAQQNDSTFHLSALMTMIQTGNASPLTAFSSLYGLESVSVTYPAVWHQLAALFATETTVVMTSKAMQLVIAVMWLINIFVLARVALPRTPGAGLFALALAQIIPIFPVYYHVELPLWPNALGIALLPGLLAGILVFFRALRYCKGSNQHVDRITQSIVIFLGVLGITAAYPPAAFSLFLLLSGGVIVALMRVFRASWGIKAKLGVATASLFIAGTVGIIVSKTEAINWLFARPVEIGWNKLAFKTWEFLVLSPAGGESIVHKALLALYALVVLIGVVTVWRQQSIQWIALSWIVVGMFVVATLVPLPLLTHLTALWYYGSYRLMPVLAIMNILTATSALSALWTRVFARCESLQYEGVRRNHTVWVVCATLVMTMLNGAISWSYRSANAHQLYEPPVGHIVFMADADELAMIFRAKDKLTDDKLILGEGSTGATLIYIVSGHPVAYKQVTFGSVQGAGKDSAYLADHFRYYYSDPKVCEIVNRYNIGYFYADQPQSFNLKRQDIRASGLFRVPVDSPDFIELDRGGLATLYRFTGCETKQP